MVVTSHTSTFRYRSAVATIWTASGSPTRPECGGGGWPASLVQARYTALAGSLLTELESAELNNL